MKLQSLKRVLKSLNFTSFVELRDLYLRYFLLVILLLFISSGWLPVSTVNLKDVFHEDLQLLITAAKSKDLINRSKLQMSADYISQPINLE